VGVAQAGCRRQRWSTRRIARRRTFIDRLPASAELRRSGSITWPANEFKTSMAGFEHVFAHVVEVNLAGEITSASRCQS